MTNPDAATWTNPAATANAFWAEVYTSGTFYYSATIDSALDRFKGTYASSTATGTIDFILPSVTSFDTAEEIAAAKAAAAELSNGLNIAAWKIAVALENLIPCNTPVMGPTCGMIEVVEAEDEDDHEGHDHGDGGTEKV